MAAVGFISEKDLNARFASTNNLITGRGWLVRDGDSYVETTPDLNVSESFVVEKGESLNRCHDLSVGILALTQSHSSSIHGLTHHAANFIYDHFMTSLKAPRTALGVWGNGTVALVSVDGEEDINAGPDLFEFAELLSNTLGLVSAINLDGGGSETVVIEGGIVFNEPHCNDTPEICERDVGAIACLRAV